ncbi:MAG: hypothetical protein P4L81_08585 [Candidatus Pacebacteria bacterium]|nr:hypothetical protein [Candidatus Paceibacterota bacterium]
METGEVDAADFQRLFDVMVQRFKAAPVLDKRLNLNVHDADSTP